MTQATGMSIDDHFSRLMTEMQELVEAGGNPANLTIVDKTGNHDRLEANEKGETVLLHVRVLSPVKAGAITPKKNGSGKQMYYNYNPKSFGGTALPDEVAVRKSLFWNPETESVQVGTQPIRITPASVYSPATDYEIAQAEKAAKIGVQAGKAKLVL